MVAGEADRTLLGSVLGFIAIVLATINVVGGFLVTNRMLAMFKKKPSKS
jgi:NAD(P) transhydrogenase subunit alpha